MVSSKNHHSTAAIIITNVMLFIMSSTTTITTIVTITGVKQHYWFVQMEQMNHPQVTIKPFIPTTTTATMIARSNFGFKWVVAIDFDYFVIVAAAVR